MFLFYLAECRISDPPNPNLYRLKTQPHAFIFRPFLYQNPPPDPFFTLKPHVFAMIYEPYSLVICFCFYFAECRISDCIKSQLYHLETHPHAFIFRPFLYQNRAPDPFYTLKTHVFAIIYKPHSLYLCFCVFSEMRRD
jgi:hypothetical protein